VVRSGSTVKVLERERKKKAICNYVLLIKSLVVFEGIYVQFQWILL
jgi:hypothetical protein